MPSGGADHPEHGARSQTLRGDVHGSMVFESSRMYSANRRQAPCARPEEATPSFPSGAAGLAARRHQALHSVREPDSELTSAAFAKASGGTDRERRVTLVRGAAREGHRPARVPLSNGAGREPSRLRGVTPGAARQAGSPLESRPRSRRTSTIEPRFVDVGDKNREGRSSGGSNRPRSPCSIRNHSVTNDPSGFPAVEMPEGRGGLGLKCAVV
jgi:hypothetical protein